MSVSHQRALLMHALLHHVFVAARIGWTGKRKTGARDRSASVQLQTRQITAVTVADTPVITAVTVADTPVITAVTVADTPVITAVTMADTLVNRDRAVRIARQSHAWPAPARRAGPESGPAPRSVPIPTGASETNPGQSLTPADPEEASLSLSRSTHQTPEESLVGKRLESRATATATATASARRRPKGEGSSPKGVRAER
jgi:hypothetical protein